MVNEMTFEEARKIGDSFRDELLNILKTQSRFVDKKWEFYENPRTKDTVEGDIICRSSTGTIMGGIDAKRSKNISLNSIAEFVGFKGQYRHRAFFMSPYAIVNNTTAFQDWVFNEIYQLFPEYDLRQLTYIELADWLKMSYKIEAFNIEKISPIFGIMSRSKEIGISVDQIPLHFKMFYSNVDSLNDDLYWRTIYMDFKKI